jgi:hypothetical protein
MKEIPLSNSDKVALVDDEDFERLSQFKWTYEKRPNQAYATRAISTEGPNSHKRAIRMHQEILAAPPGFMIDHKNGDGLNNLRSNLRICTRAQNAHNSPKKIGGKTPYKGVGLVPKCKMKFEARIHVNKERYILGRFETAELAALAYDEAARKLHGEFARPNF